MRPRPSTGLARFRSACIPIFRSRRRIRAREERFAGWPEARRDFGGRHAEGDLVRGDQRA